MPKSIFFCDTLINEFQLAISFQSVLNESHQFNLPYPSQAEGINQPKYILTVVQSSNSKQVLEVDQQGTLHSRARILEMYVLL